MQTNSILWQEAQQYIDNNYNPANGGDGIDWKQARIDAHEALGKHFTKEEIEQALNAYQS